MIYFRNDEEEYFSWLERHPEGFVLNISTGGKHNAMLHTARCTHLYAPNPARVHTVTYPKACAQSGDELKGWALESGYTVTSCPDCKPSS